MGLRLGWWHWSEKEWMKEEICRVVHHKRSLNASFQQLFGLWILTNLALNIKLTLPPSRAVYLGKSVDCLLMV